MAPVCVMRFDCLIVDEIEIATCICKDREREIATKEIKKKQMAHSEGKKRLIPGFAGSRSDLILKE